MNTCIAALIRNNNESLLRSDDDELSMTRDFLVQVIVYFNYSQGDIVNWRAGEYP